MNPFDKLQIFSLKAIGILFGIALLFVVLDSAYRDGVKRIKKIEKNRAQGARAEKRVNERLREWIEYRKNEYGERFVLIQRDCRPLDVELEPPLSGFEKFCGVLHRLRHWADDLGPQKSINIINPKASRGANEFDHILVGPGLVLHIETKSFDGSIDIQTNETWQRWGHGYNKPHPDTTTPESQARIHHELLRSIVGQKAGVYGLICLAGDKYATVKGNTDCLDFPIYPIKDLWDYLNDLVAANNIAGRADVDELEKLINSRKYQCMVMAEDCTETRDSPAPPRANQISSREGLGTEGISVHYCQSTPVTGYRNITLTFRLNHEYPEHNASIPYSWEDHMRIAQYDAYILRERPLFKDKPQDYTPTIEDILNHPASVYRSARDKTMRYNPAKNAFELAYEYDPQYVYRKNPIWVVFRVTWKANGETTTFLPCKFIDA